MERDELLRELMKLNFLMVDLSLILNKHPENEEALNQYGKIIRTADVIGEKFKTRFGSICSFGSLMDKECMDYPLSRFLANSVIVTDNMV